MVKRVKIDPDAMIGNKYGKLLVLKSLYYKGNHNTEVFCRCDCGKELSRIASHIISGLIVSCGCERTNVITVRNRKHDHAKRHKKSKEYRTWEDINKRCRDSNNQVYGGKGISVCPEWQESFENFLKDIGTCPDIKYSIERLDNSLGYSKENCIWANRSTQSAHRGRQKNNSSGYIGVKWDKRSSKWVASIRWKGKVTEKYFSNKEMAALYRDAYIKYHELPHTLNLNELGQQYISKILKKAKGDWDIIELMIKKTLCQAGHDVIIYVLDEAEIPENAVVIK